MMHLRKIFTIILLFVVIPSCAPQTFQETQPVEQIPASVTVVPTSAPPATQKPPRGTKVPCGKQGQGQGQGQGSNASQSLSFDIPDHLFDVILGRPTANSITLSVMSATAQTLTITYGAESGGDATQTTAALQPNLPAIIELSNLQPDTAYYYTVINGDKHTFHTARASGSDFTFTIQADSHLDSNTNPQVYLQTLVNQRADKPDFAIDLGDTFMTDKIKPYTAAEPQYWAQRYYFSSLGQDVPLFLVLGNHDGEGAPRGSPGSSTGKGNAGEEMSVWSAKMRTMLFPNPVPNDFYTGNSIPDPAVGALQDYYAWTWGDALFIVLDPYWFTPPLRGDASLWTPTLGETQYQWLKSTLEASNAKWKFVFIHQLLSGYDKNGRGGVEVAPFYEWGGNNADGSYGFDAQRAGWGVPIHQLLVANHVNAVFHGHDHLFVKQELDGIIYQEVPQPSVARANGTNSATEYGYLSGNVLGSAGHLRVMVTSEQVTVDYVRAYLPQDEKSGQQNGQVDYSYIIK
jgi:hypothetical protein